MTRNWSLLSDFSSFGMYTPSPYLHDWAIFPFLHITYRILHSRCRSFGQFLYTLYSTPLGPGAELDLALRTTSSTSLKWGSFMLKSTVGSGGVVSASHGPSSCSPAGSLYVALRWSFMTSFLAGKAAGPLLTKELPGQLEGICQEGSPLPGSLFSPLPMVWYTNILYNIL